MTANSTLAAAYLERAYSTAPRSTSTPRTRFAVLPSSAEP
jgi:hypothetical protein